VAPIGLPVKSPGGHTRIDKAVVGTGGAEQVIDVQTQGLLGEAVPFNADVGPIPEVAPGPLVVILQIGESRLLHQGGLGRPLRIGDVSVFRGVEADDLLEGVLLSLPGGERELFGYQPHIVLHLPLTLHGFAAAEQGVPDLHIDPHFRGERLDFQVDRPLDLAHRNGG
jgi:hypothetical protein